MSQNPPPISIQAVLPREEAVKWVFWQSPDEALFSQEDVAVVTGHTVGMLTPVPEGQESRLVREGRRRPVDAQDFRRGHQYRRGRRQAGGNEVTWSPIEIASGKLAMWISKQIDKEIAEAASRLLGRRQWTLEDLLELRPERLVRPGHREPGEASERLFFSGRPALDLHVRVFCHEGKISAAIAATHLLPPVPGEAPLPQPGPSG